MNSINLICLLSLLVIGNLCQAQDKHALIIAIGDYDTQKTGWPKLNSANDVGLVKGLLQNQGFDAEYIEVLNDQSELKPTKGVILAYFDRLIWKLSSGDIVFVHYSGHGQQVADFSGDEFDGLDEAIVPLGAPASSIFIDEGVDPANWFDAHITDDELASVVYKIRRRVGKNGHLIFVMDSCHSGSGTRGKNSVRGGKVPLVPENWRMPEVAEAGGFGLNSERQIQIRRRKNLGKFVLFSGAGASELNKEVEGEDGKGYGSLTYAMYEVFQTLKPGETYGSTFEKVRSEMITLVPEQNPTIEGDADYELFSGKIHKSRDFFDVLEVKSGNESTINGGRLQGIYPGTSLLFFPRGTVWPEGKAIMEGEVVASDVLSARVILNRSNVISDVRQIVAFVKEYSLPISSTRVFLDSIGHKDLSAQLERLLPDEPLISRSAYVKADILLKSEDNKAGKFVQIINAWNGKLICELEISNSVSIKVINALRNYSQGRLVQNMDYSSDKYHLEMELLPVKFREVPTGFAIEKRYDPDFFRDASGMLLAPHGVDSVSFILKVKNTGPEDAYFNIIDIQPDGIINPIIPNNSDLAIPPKELMVRAGCTKEIEAKIDVFEPYGDEIFKLITSSAPLNLQFSMNPTRSITKGTDNPFEKLFGKIFNTGVNRGQATVSVGGTEISTTEFPFRIISPQAWETFVEMELKKGK